MENKFLWLCAFIDVLETLYVGTSQIGSFPLIFLHSYFWGLGVFSLWQIFFIEFEPFVKSVTLKQSVCHEVMRTFLKSTDALQPKGSMAEPVAAAAPSVLPAGLRSRTPQPPRDATTFHTTTRSNALYTEAHSRREEQCKQSKITFVFLFNDSLMYFLNF